MSHFRVRRHQKHWHIGGVGAIADHSHVFFYLESLLTVDYTHENEC